MAIRHRRIKQKPFDPDKWIEKYLRRMLGQLWQWWPPRKTFKNSKEGIDGLYPCDNCNQRFDRAGVDVDHILPAVPVDLPNHSWDEKIRSRLCFDDNMQLLCKLCHKAKSKIEAGERAKARRKRKKANGST